MRAFCFVFFIKPDKVSFIVHFNHSGYFLGDFFMAGDNKTLFQKALGDANSLVAGTEDQNTTFVDLRDPIKGFFRGIADVATSVSRFVNRQF
ncbi:MAG: hypothetical protein ACKO43_07240, partial [Alphaproteobacteria bacterium]